MLIFLLQTLAGILAGGTSLTSTEQIDFSHPSNRKEEGAGATLNLYIYDIRESKQMQHSGRQIERRLTRTLQPKNVHWSPSWFDISMLLTVWDRTALGEHHLMSEAITVLLRHRLLREEFLVSELRGYGNLNMTVSLEPQIEAGSLWSALTIPLRPALYIMVSIPFEPESSSVPLVLERIFQMQNQLENGSIETITKKVVIAGVVRSAVTNQPLLEAEIKVMGTEKSTNSNKEGLFYFENLSRGNYILLLNCPGYLPIQVNVLVDSENCNFKEILLTPA
ncbi:Pvc16 family protein [Nostoc sphaeroides CHAB 2801]|uniref:Pvc16 family protein n=1 Tax=Nostoc sphaeroides TaxID=446679 RepID=UPI001E4719D6|nr:Pvc16 family protein [Nostoc sphaeroides]MCC5632289.1 Pvc16 family protein [Nostoc sphaeroides CHAB 2801]